MSGRVLRGASERSYHLRSCYRSLESTHLSDRISGVRFVVSRNPELESRMTGTEVCVYDPTDPLAWSAAADMAEENGQLATAAVLRGLDLSLTWIPPGEFMMGSPETERGRFGDEGPQHLVKLTHGFYMGTYQVTQRQWELVMGANPSYFKGPNRPVETVSWNDCQDFCQKLSGMTGLEFRLPLEAEWEYTCRAGTTTAYSFGDDPEQLGDYAWYVGNSDNQTHDVGLKKPNPWGLYDMHGNVWEWCQDVFKPYTAEMVVIGEGGKILSGPGSEDSKSEEGESEEDQDGG